MGVKNIRISQEMKENILSFEEYFEVFSNRTKTVTAFVFLWAARDISCEALSVREEAEQDKVKSLGAWYTTYIIPHGADK